MRVGKSLRKNTLKKVSLQSKIEELEKQIALLKKYQHYEEYFSKIGKKKNDFIVEMRRLLCKELYSAGLSKSDIGRIIHRDHSTVIHALKSEAAKDVHEAVAQNYKTWIADNVYPKSIEMRVPSHLHKAGVKSIISYKLVDLCIK